MTSRRTIRFATAFFVLLVIGVTSTGASAVGEVPGEGVSSALNGTPLLDAHPGAYAAYSLRRLRADYDGPAVRVRRSSDGAEQDVGFTANGHLDVSALEAWLGGSDGRVVTWYNQGGGADDLTGTNGPLIASAGSVYTDGQGHPRLYFNANALSAESGNTLSMPANDFAVLAVQEAVGAASENYGVLINANFDGQGRLEVMVSDTDRWWIEGSTAFGNTGDNMRLGLPWNDANLLVVSSQPDRLSVYQNAAQITEDTSVALIESDVTRWRVGTGVRGDWKGYISELVLYPGLSWQEVANRYVNINGFWQIGPSNVHIGTPLPQQYGYQVAFYDWLESLSVEDVTLPNATISWDGSYSDIDELSDLWLATKGATASDVVRSEPEWYLLDAGNGKGIEATGDVRIPHQPTDGPYGGNPARSWSNEPAYLYHLSLKNSDGSEGNPYKGDPAMGRRALVVMMVDMMMYHNRGGYAKWGDMYGKALLGWAETYRWTKDLLSAEMKASVEEGLEFFVDEMLTGNASPRAVNTNMDMFAIQAVADLYVAADSATLKSKCVQAAKDWLLGYPDGELGSKHDVFAVGDRTGGVFDPSGFIMEGDQPDVFYGGESIYHIAGAVAAVLDRDTGTLPADWVWLKEVLRRLMEWRTYQRFYDPAIHNPWGTQGAAALWTAGAGFSGRTGAGVPDAMGGHSWSWFTIADVLPNAKHKARTESRKSHKPASTLPPVADMEADINSAISFLNNKLDSYYPDSPKIWKGWSPWTKKTPFLPPKGWYSRLDALISADDPSTYTPVEQVGTYYNKAFGGYPVGDQYWAYKDTDGTREWGFFMEAQALQGGYSGWFGGKIETFWTEDTGVVLLNRHGKSGADGGWSNIEYKAAHHVWGRDEAGKAFSTIWLRGRELQRTSTFDLDGSPPSVTVNNVFNDPSHSATTDLSGEQTGNEIEGQLDIENKVEALTDGARVTHTITSNQSDEVTMLWASVPVYLRDDAPDNPGDDFQALMDDTTIEYWDGAAWQPMPEDQDGDGVPELVTTTALRLGRDFLLGDGMQYAYIAFPQSERARLSTSVYVDPYQTNARVRTVHIDLHGNPGTAQTLPASKTLQYTIQTTDPTSGNAAEFQSINLRAGWNLVSTSVEPESADMESIFSGLTSKIELVRAQDSSLYVPADGTNEIGSWDTQESYAIFATSPATLSISGSNIDPARPISLKMGWNALPYTLREPLPVDEALASIGGNVVVVKDQDGKVYMPSIGIDNIGVMEPGRGYLVYVDQDITLSYPD